MAFGDVKRLELRIIPIPKLNRFVLGPRFFFPLPFHSILFGDCHFIDHIFNLSRSAIVKKCLVCASILVSSRRSGDGGRRGVRQHDTAADGTGHVHRPLPRRMCFVSVVSMDALFGRH